VGLEVKTTATLGRADVRGLKALAEAVGKRWLRGAILYTSTGVIPFGRARKWKARVPKQN
jgi:uncharacterized protein